MRGFVVFLAITATGEGLGTKLALVPFNAAMHNENRVIQYLLLSELLPANLAIMRDFQVMRRDMFFQRIGPESLRAVAKRLISTFFDGSDAPMRLAHVRVQTLAA